MSRNYFLFSKPWYLWLILFLVLVIAIFICRNINKHPKTEIAWVPSENGKVSWNILFKPGADKEIRNQAIKNIIAYVDSIYRDYNAKNGTSYKIGDSAVTTCPCDTLLYNYDFKLIDAAGQSAATVPTKPGPRGSGDFLGAIISNNIAISNPVEKAEVAQYGYDTISVKNIGADGARILAIIDSGIDSTKFGSSLKNMIWTDPEFPTLYNFIPGQFTHSLFDSTKEKHGSAVAGIIIKAMENVPVYPKLMILKALDRYNKGTIFSVSCALSYAIQKKAALINLSLGYYGEADSILHHYLELCKTTNSSTYVFAAAGNTPGNHTLPLCNNNTNNLLAGTRLFYPACFSKEINNITSVTQISREDSSCFYQNYSDEFISLGVYDSLNCCAVQVGFIGGHGETNKTYYEGTSFATPVASGLKMATMLQSLNEADANLKWNSMIRINTNLNKVTVGGKYISYSPVWLQR